MSTLMERVGSVPWSPGSLPHLLFADRMDILSGGIWFPVVILVGISPVIIRDAEHLALWLCVCVVFPLKGVRKIYLLQLASWKLVVFGIYLCNTSNRRRRQWHPTPVHLPGKSHGWRSLIGCSPWGHWGSDTTERLHFHFSLWCIGEGNGNLLQCCCLENPRDGGAWWAAVHGVAQSRTRLKWLSSSSSNRTFPEDSCQSQPPRPCE